MPTLPRKEHSQIIATRQPLLINAVMEILSLATLAANFACQNSVRVAGVVA